MKIELRQHSVRRRVSTNSTSCLSGLQRSRYIPAPYGPSAEGTPMDTVLGLHRRRYRPRTILRRPPRQPGSGPPKAAQSRAEATPQQVRIFQEKSGIFGTHSDAGGSGC